MHAKKLLFEGINDRDHLKIALAIKQLKDLKFRHEDHTPLTFAASLPTKNHHDICEFLIEAGADVDGFSNGKASALMWATYNGDVDLMNLLIANGANVDLRSPNEHVAMHIAVSNRKYNAVCVLFEHGANPDIKNNEGLTSLMLAVKKGTRLILEKLIPISDLSIKNDEGKTVKDMAYRVFKEHIVEQLFPSE